MMKSRLNFIVKRDGKIFDMHELGIWVSSFHIYSPNPTRNKLVVPGRPGAYLVGTQEEERHVRIALQIETDDLQEFDEMKHKIFELFYSEEPFSIIRDIAPDKEIFVLQEGEYDIENLSDSDGEFEITLTMLDPYLYGPEKEAIFPSDVVSLNYNGTAPGDPVFELEATQPVTFAMIQNQNEEYMMIGKPADAEQTTVNTRTLILDERGETLNTWSKTPTQIDAVDAVVTGSFGTDGVGITVASYGTGERWHGPALIKEVPVTQDFEVEMLCEAQTNRVNETFRIEFYLFDESMNVIGKMNIWDNSPSFYRIAAEGRYGPYVGDNVHYMISGKNYQFNNWDYYRGVVRMRREGNTFEFYTARINDKGTHYQTLKVPYVDSAGTYSGRLKYVQIHIGTFGSYGYPGQVGGSEFFARINRIRVYALQKATVDQTPYIAQPGDIITFDHIEKKILINGEARNDLKDFGARYFKLQKGQNKFVVMPSNSLAVRIRFRERFL